MDFVVWPIKSEASTREMIKRSQGWKKAYYPIALVLNLGLFLYPLLMAVWRVRFSQNVEIVDALLLGLVLIGRLVTLTGSATLRRSVTGLRRTGIFRYTRNPISLGTHLTFLGLVVLYGHWWIGVLFVFMIIDIHYKILHEEKVLAGAHGNDYISYCQQTPRYLIL